jgi:hypothetical protein
MTDRKTQKRRLERAGFVHVAVWLPAAYAARVQAQADTYRDEVQRVLDAPAAPRGRPRNPDDDPFRADLRKLVWPRKPKEESP